MTSPWNSQCEVLHGGEQLQAAETRPKMQFNSRDEKSRYQYIKFHIKKSNQRLDMETIHITLDLFAQPDSSHFNPVRRELPGLLTVLACCSEGFKTDQNDQKMS